MKCKKCGAKLSDYWYYTPEFMFQRCKVCGELHRKPRVKANWVKK